MRCHDDDFQSYILAIKRLRPAPGLAEDDEMTASALRQYLGIASRSELSTNPEAAEKWRKLNAEYEAWMTDKQYAEARR